MIILHFIVGALAYSAKGGWLDKIDVWIALHEKLPAWINEIPYHRVLPLLIIFLATAPFAPLWQAALFTIAWAYCFSSMGEEAGAVGDFKNGGWGDYLTAQNPDGSPAFGRSYGIKKALQWGLAWGGLLTLVTGCVWFVPAGVTFPVCYFIGSSIAALRGQKGWAYAEPIYGAVMGLATGVWLDGL